MRCNRKAAPSKVKTSKRARAPRRGGRRAHAAAGARVDGAERRPERAVAAGFDLDEDERAAVERDDVDLARRPANVAREHPQAEPMEIARRRLFGAASEFVAAAHA